MTDSESAAERHSRELTEKDFEKAKKDSLVEKYFIYDPAGNGFETFATLSEQAKAAEEIITNYLDYDDGWPEEVEDIVSGIIVEKATKCEVVNRPEKLDDEGYDEEGQYWPEEIDHLCNYEMHEI